MDEFLSSLINKLLGCYLWDGCMCYIDDIIVYGNTFHKMLANLELVLQCIRDHGLRLKQPKCELTCCGDI